MGNRLKNWCLLLCASLVTSCGTTSGLSDGIRQVPMPNHWQQTQQQGTEEASISVEHQWLSQIGGEQYLQLNTLVEQALANNQALMQQAIDVQIKQQQLLQSGSALWPSLDGSFSHSRRKIDAINELKTLKLELGYELDIWGKLSDSEREANLIYLAAQTQFEQARQQLVADVVTAWFALIEARQVLEVYRQRVDNSQQNLQIIESGYRQGLNNALDVYLTRNELNNELSKVAQQQLTQNQLTRQLERLLGQYPSSKLLVTAQLPLLQGTLPLGLPSELVKRKPEILTNWYLLLAKDAALAYAHKQRFPSLNIRADLSQGGPELKDVLSGSVAWSLLGNLTAPIFDAGRLEAKEQQARLSLRQDEQRYLASLYDAFNAVENAISTETALKQRYQVMIKAQKNALAAKTLSFEQYQNGLVSYTTVLDAQSRAFDAQTTVIQIKNQLIANRIKLHVALGGDFAKPTDVKKVP